MRFLIILFIFLLVLLLVNLFIKIKRKLTRKKPLETIKKKKVRQKSADVLTIRYSSFHLLFFVYYFGLLGFCALMVKAMFDYYMSSPEHSLITIIMIGAIVVVLFVLSLMVLNWCDTRIFVNMKNKTIRIRNIFSSGFR